jgi:hypothetical protein
MSETTKTNIDYDAELEDFLFSNPNFGFLFAYRCTDCSNNINAPNIELAQCAVDFYKLYNHVFIRLNDSGSTSVTMFTLVKGSADTVDEFKGWTKRNYKSSYIMELFYRLEDMFGVEITDKVHCNDL